MRNTYYIFVVAHSIRGRIRRIHIPQYSVYLCGLLALVGLFTVLAAVGSYARMLLKVVNYNHMRMEVNALRQNFSNLQAEMDQTQTQLTSLQDLASEVSVAYGIRRAGNGSLPVAAESERAKTFGATAEHFRFLVRASYFVLPYRHEFLEGRFLTTGLPLDWPLKGRLTGSFGDRLDPFNGEGSFHAGVDIATYYGAPVRAAADGVVLNTSWESGYGRAVTLAHGRGVRTMYAHLAGFNVASGQVVLAGETVGFVGRSGRSTGPHLHYEVRIQNTPVNPTRFLGD